MADQEALVERLMIEHQEFRHLREEHQQYEQELTSLQRLPFLSTDQEWRESELKKLKLMTKDRMEAILREARANHKSVQATA
jgi:uncharacterized protein YdcH (DUF465 family)